MQNVEDRFVTLAEFLRRFPAWTAQTIYYQRSIGNPDVIGWTVKRLGKLFIDLDKFAAWMEGR